MADISSAFCSSYDAINNIVEKYKGENPSKDEAKPQPSEEEQKAELMSAIELLEMLGDDIDDEAKEALEILKSLV